MKRRKIAFVISSLTSGGAERVVSTISNELVKNFDITLIMLFRCKPFYTLDERINVVYCKKKYTEKLSIIQSLTNSFNFIFCISKIIKKEQIELVIGFMSTTNIYTIISAKLKGIPSIVSERIHPEYSSLNNFWSSIRRIVYPLNNMLIVQTEEIESYFERFIDPSKIEIIKNPLSFELISSIESLKEKENIILNVGRLTHQKNQDLLIEAFSEIDHKDWKLNIIGTGPNKFFYESLIKKLNIEDSVEIIEDVNHIQNYYNKASIFAFTSRFEGFPNALTEAMAFGIPCISTDCPSGPSELIHNGENGFLIPVEDKNELIKTLQLLMNDKHLRKKLGDNAIQSTKRFGVEKISLEWERLINNLLNH